MSASLEPCSVCVSLNLSRSRIFSGVSSSSGRERTLVAAIGEVAPCGPACLNSCALEKVQTPLVRTARSACRKRQEPSCRIHVTFGLIIRVLTASYSSNCQTRCARGLGKPLVNRVLLFGKFSFLTWRDKMLCAQRGGRRAAGFV